MIAKPNLFIVGSPKCGTTTLAKFLAGSPFVFTPAVKEPAFFCIEKRIDSYQRHFGKKLYFPIDSLDKYESLYQRGKHFRYRIDASVDYFDSVSAPSAIKNYSPYSKIIIILRKHEDFLLSLYTEMVNSAGETPGVYPNCLIVKPDMRVDTLKRLRSLSDVDYQNRVSFSKHLDRYYAVFGRDHILLLNFNDLKASQEKIRHDIGKFLDIDTSTLQFEHANKRRARGYDCFESLVYYFRFYSLGRFVPHWAKTSIFACIPRRRLTGFDDHEITPLPLEIRSLISEDLRSLRERYDFSF